MKFNQWRAYRATICIAGAFEVLCPFFERAYATEIVAEWLAAICIGVILLSLCVAVFWVRNASVPHLVGAAFLTIAIPFVNALILWLATVQLFVHGVGFALFFLHGALSLIAVLLLFISAGVKHIRSIN